MTKSISWCFLLYFIILFSERLQSLIRVIIERSFFIDGFNTYVNIVVTLSLLTTLVLLLFFNKGFYSSLFKDTTPSWNMLVLTMGVLLLSGMVHTKYTISGIQFLSYGILILGLILNTIKSTPTFKGWYSLVFLVLFSMAIPVMYQSNIKYNLLFHTLEAVASIILVLLFTYMVGLSFKGRGENLLLWIPALITLLFDTLLIALRWNEEKNIFVLIFLVLSTFAFILGKILFKIIK